MLAERLADDMELSLEVEPTAAGRARRALAGTGLVDSAREPTLLLLVSELVSNSVRHAGLTEAERIRLRCLGLHLVDAMADRWGVARGARETCVWFELDCAEAA